MIRHDLTHWPLVLTVARGAMTPAEHRGLLAEWNRWLDRGERFATLRVFADGDALVRPDGAARDAGAWLQANAARMRAQVLGMATVVPAGQLGCVGRMKAAKLSGVPAEAFRNISPALNFLGWFIAPPEGGVWDRAAIGLRLHRCLREEGAG